MTNKNITLNVWKDNSEFAMAIQGEVDSRFLTISLKDNDGPVDLTNKNVNFLAKKPDGTVVFNRMKVDNPHEGIAVLELTSQMSAVPGFLEGCEVHIMSETGETLIAKKINILIQPSLGEAAEESLSELTAFQELVKNVSVVEAHTTDKFNPHEVTATQVGALPIDTKYGAMLEQDGSNLSLKDQNGEPLSTIAVSASTSTSVATSTSDGLMSAGDKGKLDGIETGAKVNIQSDWAQADSNADDYIKNKPTIPTKLTDLVGTLPISQGGTEATTVDKALTNFRLYTSVTDLGLSYPCTAVDIIKAMPVNSEAKIAINSRSGSITDLPEDFCLLTVRYNYLNRYQIFCTQMTSGGSSGTYIGNYVRNTSISWEKILTDNCECPTLQTSSKTIIDAINELYNLIK